MGAFAYLARMGELHTIEPEPLGEDVEPLIRRVLASAQAGEVSAIGIAIVRRDGTARTLWSFPPRKAGLLGAVHRLAHRLNRAMDGE